MAYLAEVHDIWGPFLVIAPASTLHNWQQEITRFVPQLKCLPYWGNTKDRATLRKFWNRKQISYNQDAPFHVLITSYQLVSRARSSPPPRRAHRTDTSVCRRLYRTRSTSRGLSGST